MPRKPKFDTIDEDEFEIPEPKAKAKTKKRLPTLEESDDEEVVEKPKAKSKLSAKKIRQDVEQSDEEKSAPFHECPVCEKQWACKDGKFKTIKGKEKFKCSCQVIRNKDDLYFFCSKKCKAAAEKPQEDSDDEGYNSV